MLISVSILFLFNICNAQKSKRDKFLQVINAKYPNHRIDTIKGTEVVLTKIWETHAVIPVDESHTIDFKAGIGAVCFTVYLSENPNDFEIMKSENIVTMEQVDEQSGFTGGDQRLIQLIFYDFKNDAYLGKPDEFPITGLPWVPEYFEIPLEHTFVENMVPVLVSDNTCLLTIAELGDEHPARLYYVIKFHKNKLYCSEPHRGSLIEIKAKKNAITATFMSLTEPNYLKEYEKILLEFEE